MAFIFLLPIFLCAQSEIIFEQPVSIDTSGSNVDPSSILDLNSDRRGVLIPRMTTAQRLLISNPATGLLLFDTDTKSFWFYNSSSWSDLSSAPSGTSSQIVDADNDTKIDVEAMADEDTIRFNVAGNEIMKLDNRTLHLEAPGSSLFIGKDAGLNDDGTDNFSTGIGFEALKNDVTGWNNTAVGYKALSKNGAGDNNTAVGAFAMENTNFGDFNVAIGQGSMNKSTSGAANVAVGYHTLYDVIGGQHNVALGSNAIRNNENGHRNIGIGSRAFYNSISGNDNVAIGDSTLFLADADGQNVVIGSRAAQNVSGSRNTYIGYETGKGIALNSAHDNVFLGYQAGFFETGSQKLYISNTDRTDPLIYGDFGTKLLRINGELNIANEYSFPELDGSANDILQTDGFGNLNWADVSSLSPFERNGTTIRQISNYNDDFLFGRSAMPTNGSVINNGLLMYDDSKSAFRVGRIEGENYWSPDSIGVNSVAMGYNTKAKGVASFAMGNRSFAIGENSTAIGHLNQSRGDHSFALGGNNISEYNYTGTLGRGLITGSLHEIAVGVYNTTYTANDPSGWDANDRIFVVGNGIGLGGRSDALVVKKSGNTTINGQLTVGASFNNFSFPLGDGSVNQRLETNGSGSLLWVDAPDLAFESTGGLLRPTSSFDDDFVVCSNTLPANGVSTFDALHFYDNSKRAFRSGFLNSSKNWSPDSIGIYSVAMGLDTKAKGNASFAVGDGTESIGESSFAGGEDSEASGDFSFTYGLDNTSSGNRSVSLGGSSNASGLNSTAIGFASQAEGNYSVSLGYILTAHSAFETSIGRYNTNYTPASTTAWNTTDRLFVIGNGTGISNRNNALVVYKDGDAEFDQDVLVGNDLDVDNDLNVSVDLDVNGVSNLSGNVTLSNDLYAGASNGVINAGGGTMSATINMIGDSAPASPIVDGDEDLYIQDDLQIGGVPYKPGGGSWTTSSDLRLKKNISSFDDGLSKVMQIRPVNFKYNDIVPENNDGKNYVGIIAQEMLEVAPYMISETDFGRRVIENENGENEVLAEGEKFYTYDSSALIYMLVNAVKELKAENDDMKLRLEALEK